MPISTTALSLIAATLPPYGSGRGAQSMLLLRLLWAAVVGALYSYVYVPVVLWRKFRLPAVMRYTVVDEAAVPAAQRASLAALAATVERLGFERRAWLTFGPRGSVCLLLTLIPPRPGFRVARCPHLRGDVPTLWAVHQAFRRETLGRAPAATGTGSASRCRARAFTRGSGRFRCASCVRSARERDIALARRLLGAGGAAPDRAAQRVGATRCDPASAVTSS